MSITYTSKTLRESLAQLEAALQTPIVSGEQTAWLNDAHQACQKVGEGLRCSEQAHYQLVDKIVEHNRSASEQANQLREAESALTAQYNAVEAKLALLCERSRAVQPDELKLEKPISELIRQGLAFILAARKHDTVITTLYEESGAGDTSAASPAAANSACEEAEKDIVEEASEESFPASDPPSWTPITSS